MAKDRSAPFSRKHRRYWLPVTGGMLLIGAINLGLGYCSWPDTPFDRTPERIIPQLPVSEFARPASAQPSTEPTRGSDADPSAGHGAQDSASLPGATVLVPAATP